MDDSNIERVAELLLDGSADDDLVDDDGYEPQVEDAHEPQHSAADDATMADSGEIESDDKAAKPEAPAINPNALSQLEQVKTAEQDLVSAVDQIEKMFQNRELSAEQYQAAMQNAQAMGMQLKEASLALREQSLATSAQVEQWHKQVQIDGWQDTKTREKIQSQLKNWVSDELGWSEAEIKSLAGVSPKQLEFLYDTFKKSHPEAFEKKRPNAKVRKALAKLKNTKQDTEVRSTGGPLSGRELMGSQIDEVAKLLGG